MFQNSKLKHLIQYHLEATLASQMLFTSLTGLVGQTPGGLQSSVGIRNQGTLAGNLMLKNAHNDFPSDVFICLATVGATLEIVDQSGSSQSVPVEDFVKMKMHKKFIKTIHDDISSSTKD